MFFIKNIVLNEYVSMVRIESYLRGRKYQSVHFSVNPCLSFDEYEEAEATIRFISDVIDFEGAGDLEIEELK